MPTSPAFSPNFFPASLTSLATGLPFVNTSRLGTNACSASMAWKLLAGDHALDALRLALTPSADFRHIIYVERGDA